MEQSDVEIKDCPFCGGRIRLEGYEGSSFVKVKGHKRSCFMFHCTYNHSINGSATYFNDKDDYVRQWNKRE